MCVYTGGEKRCDLKIDTVHLRNLPSIRRKYNVCGNTHILRSS